jgi:hypothetical protein
VAKIIFYHQPHTLTNGEPAHSKHDLDSIARQSFFAPQMSQAFKDHIWTQLGLSYIVKQIYDKHKAILWAKINVGEVMTKNDFIKQQDIIYLGRKHKRGIHIYTKIWPFLFAHGHLIIQIMFYFQDEKKFNEVHVPFITRIQTPFQLQAMVSLGDNGAISMDPTFDTQ